MAPREDQEKQGRRYRVYSGSMRRGGKSYASVVPSPIENPLHVAQVSRVGSGESITEPPAARASKNQEGCEPRGGVVVHNGTGKPKQAVHSPSKHMVCRDLNVDPYLVSALTPH